MSLSIHKNELLAIVGESGCGKSALAFSIIGLHTRAKIEGTIEFKGQNLAKLSNEELNKLRGLEDGMIFQDPLTALNPLMIIGEQIGEVIYLHNKNLSKAERKERVIELLNKVGIPRPEHTYESYPHELSGGMRQRVMIAIALACNPNF